MLFISPPCSQRLSRSHDVWLSGVAGLALAWLQTGAFPARRWHRRPGCSQQPKVSLEGGFRSQAVSPVCLVCRVCHQQACACWEKSWFSFSSPRPTSLPELLRVVAKDSRAPGYRAGSGHEQGISPTENTWEGLPWEPDFALSRATPYQRLG